MEKLNTKPEIRNDNPDSSPSNYELPEQLASIENNPENSIEAREKQAEQAKTEALEKAKSIETIKDVAEKSPDRESSSRRGPIGKPQLKESYKKTMERTQKEMSPTGRAFSKIIHNNIVEKSSEVLGSTIARPTAILSGAFMAFILTLTVYIVAKTIGYQLSGFETIAAFAIGWTIGLIYDYLKLIITGKR